MGDDVQLDFNYWFITFVGLIFIAFVFFRKTMFDKISCAIFFLYTFLFVALKSNVPGDLFKMILAHFLLTIIHLFFHVAIVLIKKNKSNVSPH